MGKNANKALSLKEASERSSFKALSLKENVDDVRRLAMYLCDKFNDEKSMNFYLKCAWHLSDDYLINLAERAKIKRVPKAYFLACASRELQKVRPAA